MLIVSALYAVYLCFINSALSQVFFSIGTAYRLPTLYRGKNLEVLQFHVDLTQINWLLVVKFEFFPASTVPCRLHPTPIMTFGYLFMAMMESRKDPH